MSEPTTQTIEHLLTNVTHIRNKYDEFAKITGENYNLLQILGKEHHENYHSAIICDLLNENGSHCQGNLYLKLFIDIIQIRLKEDNQNRNLKNEIKTFEKSTAETEDVIEDGRVDIFIKDENQAVIIENKIGAIDQYMQLKRYYDYVKPRYHENFLLIYLWKESINIEEYNENSTFGKEKEDIKNVRSKTVSISYEREIKTWIETCIKESWDIPPIREVLKQYLNTINKITNHSTNNKMEKEILNLIINDENKVTSALFLANNINRIKEEIIKIFIEQIKTGLDKIPSIVIKLNKEKETIGITDSGFDVEFDNKEQFTIQFYFEQDYKCFIFGIKNRRQEIIQPERDKVTEQLKGLTFRNLATNTAWHHWYYIARNYDYFSLEKILTANERNETVKRHIDLIIKIIAALKDFELN